MAQANEDWPSEDEDFDVTMDKNAVAASNIAVDDDDSDSTESSKSAGRDVDETTAAEPESEAPENFDESEQPEPAEEPQAAEAGETFEDQPSEQPTEPEADHNYEAEPESEPAAATTEAAPETEFTEPQPAVATGVRGPNGLKRPKFKLAKNSRLPSLRLLAEAVLVIAVIGLGLSAWSLHSDRNDLKKQVTELNNNPQIAVQKQTTMLINQVASLMTLPTDETPTIASVSDASKAKQQSAFFNNAQNGDKVLMYVKAGEAILYRPSTQKIILVAPLTFSNQTTPTTSSTTTTQSK